MWILLISFLMNEQVQFLPHTEYKTAKECIDFAHSKLFADTFIKQGGYKKFTEQGGIVTVTCQKRI